MNDSIKENLLLIAIVGAYVFSVVLLLKQTGMVEFLTIKCYYNIFFMLFIFFSSCILLVIILKNETWNYINARSIAGVVIVFFLMPLFKSAFASMKQAIPYINHFSCDYFLMKTDEVLHLGHQPWEIFSSLLNYKIIIQAIDIGYVLWFIVLLLFCLLMAWSKRRRLRLNFFIVTLIVWAIFGSVLGTVFSSVGPCYYDKIIVGEENPFQPLMEKLYEIDRLKPLWAIHNQKGLWEAYITKRWLPFGGISAMPSVHVAMAAVFVFTALEINIILGIIFVVYLIMIQIGSVILGWHYAIDGYLSFFLTYIAWRAVKKMPIKLTDIETYGEIGQTSSQNNSSTPNQAPQA